MNNGYKATVSFFALLMMSTGAGADMKMSEAEYREGMIGPGTLSLMESKLALTKATNPKVKEFAGFETKEQTALGTILKELGTAAPDMSAKDKATLKALEDAGSGAEFDALYIKDQIDGHKMLLEVNSSYLANAEPAASGSKEAECRHLALFVNQAIEQHIANTTEIQSMLR